MNVYELFRRQWSAGQHRGVAGDALFMGDSRSAAQVRLSSPDKGTVVRFAVSIPETHVVHYCWATPTGQGVVIAGDRTNQPIPPAATDVLAHALPMPRTHSVHGYTHEGRCTALAYFWLGDNGFVNASDFVLLGQRTPDLWRDTAGCRHLSLRHWWTAVDRGSITILDRTIARSAHPIEMGKRAGTYHYLLAHAAESWTGVTGPALYTYAGRHDITTEQAQRAHGTDIRPRFVFAR